MCILTQVLHVGSQIPVFSIPDQNGEIRSDADFRGKWLVVYFYPKDDTPGCTTEACSFRDNFLELKEKGIEVVGISKDSVKSHKKFVDKYQLPFTLLANPDLDIIKAFGAWGKRKFWGREFSGILRTTFLIDPKGVVKKVYESVTPADHAKEILADWKSLQ